MSQCPICGRPTEPDARPFCSRRCANLDLQRWLTGKYAVPIVEDESEEAPLDPYADEE
jgi:uncharacterized protein